MTEGGFFEVEAFVAFVGFADLVGFEGFEGFDSFDGFVPLGSSSSPSSSSSSRMASDTLFLSWRIHSNNHAKKEMKLTECKR